MSQHVLCGRRIHGRGRLHYTFAMRVPFRFVATVGLCVGFIGLATGQEQRAASQRTAVCVPCVRGDMSFLAADEMHGRGSATRDEHLAALYVASLFAGFGLEPGGESNSFLQKARLPVPLPATVQARLKGFVETPRTETWNVVGILRGTNAAAGGIRRRESGRVTQSRFSGAGCDFSHHRTS